MYIDQESDPQDQGESPDEAILEILHRLKEVVTDLERVLQT